MNKLGSAAAIARIEIERRKGEIIIFIYTARPGVIIGRSGKGVEDLKNLIQKKATDKAKIEVMEIKNPDIIASLVAQNIAWQISKRVHFKRAVKFAIDKVMQAGAKGVKIRASGRLGGAEIARTEKYSAGLIPLSRLRANIDFAYIGALTTYGIIGIKVWIYTGENNPLEK
jgi:small subunit ribosomal protein S3